MKTDRRTTPVLVIHGGAGRKVLSKRKKAGIRKKLERVLAHSYRQLEEKDALSAVVEAVRLLEDDPYFNAGTGSQLQADGKARLSASVMDGASGRFASVLNVQRIKNPVLVAKALLKDKHRLLLGEGALDYALSLGFKSEDVRTKKSVARWEKAKGRIGEVVKMGTVGACALDALGCLAAATSTGGIGMEAPGRVSDTGMPVANFANAQVAVSATGVGEEIIDAGLAVKIATRVEDGMDLRQAFFKTFRQVQSRGGRMGAVAVDRRGHVEAQTTTEVIIYGCKKGNKQIFF